MAEHFSAQVSLRQMNVWGPNNLGLNWNRRDLYNYKGIHVTTLVNMDLSVRLTLLIYLHSKRLKQTLSPNMAILFRTIKKHVNLNKLINGHQHEKA